MNLQVVQMLFERAKDMDTGARELLLRKESEQFPNEVDRVRDWVKNLSAVDSGALSDNDDGDNCGDDENYLPGDIIHGRWRVNAVRRGGMGVVYLVDGIGEDSHLHYAFKTLQKRFFSNAKVCALFEQEGRIWARIGRHPYILPAYGVLDIAGRPYVVTPAQGPCDSCSNPKTVEGYLQEWQRCMQPYPVPALFHVVLGCCFALEYGVARGLVRHGDIKPSNILWNEENNPLLCDFGLATAVGLEIRLAAGSRGYSAPEILAGENGDIRSDVYSLGVVLYRMLTIHLGLPIPRSCDDISLPLLGDDFREIVNRATAIEPVARYASMEEFRADLMRKYNWLLRKNGRSLTAEQVYGDYFRWLREHPADRRTDDEVLADSSFELKMGRFEEAYQLLGRLVDSANDQHREEAFTSRAETLLRQGKPAEALQDANRGLDLNPDNWRALSFKAGALIEFGRYDEALECLQREYSLKPHALTTLTDFAWFYLRIGNTQKSLEWLDRAQEVDPKSVYVLRHRTTLLNGLHRWPECYEAATKAIGLGDRDPETFASRIISLGKMNRLDEYVAACESMVEALPQDYRGWLGAGGELHRLGRAEKGHDYLRHVLDMELPDRKSVV
jgi:serine/threonine protein kinase